ncbi:hypothetical protein ACA910_010297 [Epithemia clementina (nom. ined.)]
MGACAENPDRGSAIEEFDPMVVVFGASKKTGLVSGCPASTARHPIRRRNCILLATASIICGAMIVWNHISAATVPNAPLLTAKHEFLVGKVTGGRNESSSRERETEALSGENKGQESLPAVKKRHRGGTGIPNHLRDRRSHGIKRKKPVGQQMKWNQERAYHRRLSDKNEEPPTSTKLKLWLYQTRRFGLYIWKYWFGQEKDFFFAEDEILNVWNEAENLVENNLDNLVYADLKHKFARDRKRRQKEERRRHLLESVSTNASLTEATDTFESNNTQLTTNKTYKSMSLDLPTLREHASDGVLMLYQGDKLINQTNAAAQEAASSSKAMLDTAAAVSAVLNDPTSVEARICCTSILNVYHENCSPDDEEELSDRRLFLIVLVMALCGIVKSLIRHYRILWLPEAAGCILVGIASGYVLMFFPHHDISFDGHWFLRIMVPPIIFEAALSIDKKSFNRHVVPILLYAVLGTLFATVVTAEILHRGSTLLSRWCTPIPYVESLTFGALISSIDPIAVLSVLSNMGLNDKDTIYVLIFGESLLNDGVAIVLFETLVHFLNDHTVIDNHEITQATYHFLVVALGSLLVGALGGYAGTVYFWLFQGCQTPLVEVILFFCWALLPYYVCDGIGWSGIVSAVATGFIMDIHIVGQREERTLGEDGAARTPLKPHSNGRSLRDVFPSIFSHPDGHLSGIARAHIGFVAGLIATTMETAIFAYLGLFLFSHRYHWSFFHAVIAILACCLSRGIMIPLLSFFANASTQIRQMAFCDNRQSNPAGVYIGHKMQFVLWFAGLRGAMSFALVESIPLYDSVSGVGTPFKPELKAMTSGCIMFTIFVLGGYTYYVMDGLGLAPGRPDEKMHSDLSPLVEDDESEDASEPSGNSIHDSTPKSRRRLRPITSH